MNDSSITTHPLLQVQRSFWDTFFAVHASCSKHGGHHIHPRSHHTQCRPSVPSTPQPLQPNLHPKPPAFPLAPSIPSAPMPPFESPPHISDVFIGSSQSTICTHPYHLIGPFCSLVHINLLNLDFRVLVSALSVRFIIAFEIQMIFSFSLVDNSW